MPALQIPHSNEKISSLLTTNLKLSRRKRNIKKSNTGSMLRKISIDVLINKYQKKIVAPGDFKSIDYANICIII
jgi:hypothetical protein